MNATLSPSTLLTTPEPGAITPEGPLAAPTRLRVDHHRPGPTILGGTFATPSLSFEIPTAPAGWALTLAEVEVSRSFPASGAVGNESEVRTATASLRITSPTAVAWPFPPLAAGEAAQWRVRVAGEDGAWSDWSAPHTVEAGPLARSDWQAEPITAPGNKRADAAPVLVKRITVPEGTSAARLDITAGGIYEAYVDGVKIGSDELAPGWTEYCNRILVQTHDLTPALTPGEHEIAIVLGNGWYRGHLTWLMRENIYGDQAWVLAQVRLGGSEPAVIGTDATWSWRPSNITANDLYNGQDVDLRRPALGEVGEEAPVVTLPWPEAALEPTTLPLPAVIGELEPVEVITTPSGKKILDFGQNLTGHLRMKVHGQSGATLRIIHAEVLEHGELGTRPLRNAKATDTFTLSGGEDVLAPTLTQHGFRYAQVEGFPGSDDELLAATTARVVSAAMERVGWFDSSHPLVNRLVENARWSTIDNFITVPTDCPQRDERLGWTGDIGAFAPASLALYDATAFLASWAKDLAWAQTPDGALPVVSPDVLEGTKLTCAWGDAITLVPWACYEATGDEAVLAASVEAMACFVDGVAAVAGESHLWRGGFQFGDWLDPDAPPEDPAAAKANTDVVATAYFARSAGIVASAYGILGNEERAAHYRALEEAVKKAYCDAYVTPDGLMLSDCATVYAQALAWDLLDTPERVRGAGQRLADLVRLRAFRISTGFVGTPLVPAALVKGGQVATACRLILEEHCPSWLYPVTMGATTIWERWDSMLPDGTINPGEMTSFNHYALGAVSEWLMGKLAGLELLSPGGSLLLVQPVFGHGFSHARVTRHLPTGVARSGWKLEGRRLTVSVTVPVGSQAQIVLPGREPFTVGHGRYEYAVELPAGALEAAPIRTVRDLIDDPTAWQAVLDAVKGKHPVYGEDPAKALGNFLKFELDSTAMVLPSAASVYGFVPGMGEVAHDLKALVATLAPEAEEAPAAQQVQDFQGDLEV